MTTENERVVRRAFDACENGDRDELRRVFGYDMSVQIEGACPPEKDYPAGETDINYGPEDKGNGRVETKVRWRTGRKEYNGTVVDTVSNGKITASTVEWDGYPYGGETENDAAFYEDKYGWWGWPFGRRRK